MATVPNQSKFHLGLENLENRELLSAVQLLETFDQVSIGSVPSGFVQWSSGNDSFAVTDLTDPIRQRGVRSDGTSALSGRFWYDEQLHPDTLVAASIRADSLIPTQVIARGSDLDTAEPTYYAATVTRGLVVTLNRVVDGVSTELAVLKSQQWLSGQWVRVSLVPEGEEIRVLAQRTDTGEYLNSVGAWQSEETHTIRVFDARITGEGYVGVSRPSRYAGPVVLDDLEIREPGQPSLPPTQDPPLVESFDHSAIGTIPSGWSQWTAGIAGQFAVSSTAAVVGPHGFTTSGGSTSVNRAWFDDIQPADIEVSTHVLVNSLVPVDVMLRGQHLQTDSPSYYAATIQRGLEIKIDRVVNGERVTLGTMKSESYFSSRWGRVHFTAEGNTLRVSFQRLDTNQWLGSDGRWHADQTVALQLQDQSIPANGLVGLGRDARYAGDVHFDEFRAVPLGGSVVDQTPPNVTLVSPNSGSTLDGVVEVLAHATDANGIDRVEFWLDGIFVTQRQEGPYTWSFNTRSVENGSHLIEVIAYDTVGNFAKAGVTINVQNTESTLPHVPRHYDHIRVAQLAYSTTPFSEFEDNLLRESVDLVIPNPAFLERIDGVSPETPQFLYSNVSNIYLDLLSDWLEYADRNGLDREMAFYHVAAPASFTGNSGSSIPVNQFWRSWRGPTSGSGTFVSLNDGRLGGSGQSAYLGYLEPFREINWAFSKTAGTGWTGVLEYVSAVDVHGNPTAWKTLSLISNSTANFTQSGQMTFDPPSDWVPASVNGSARLYYARIRTTAGNDSLAPIATITGRDYVNANGTNSGTIPAFDYNADKNGDGYLDDTEYAARTPGMNARFVYESRLFYHNYGQQRYATNPSNPEFQAWIGEFHREFLDAHPLADGLFLDNSPGRLHAAGVALIEDTSTFTQDYATMLHVLDAAIGKRWLVANTVHGNNQTDAVVQATSAALEEFLLRPLAHNWSQFLDVADLVYRRQSAADSPRYMILDSLPRDGDPTDPRTQISTLAYYYLLADPDTTFLMIFGGHEPGTSWTRHWFDAVAHDVGRPTGEWSQFAQGADPAQSELTYRVYAREYTDALVLYKPLSYQLGQGTGSLTSATTHALNGSYRELRADGTLGPVVSTVTLRNGEGTVLIRA